ncbi:MAG: metallophosphoesterase family protein [Candidatus Eremiobacteraeota bacterium]|nr:metallophosphoesterase family protein [Candidatus Eremiobacteraeota bacterium]
MRIGIVSDTHFPRFGRALPRALERGLRRAGVEAILHLGDMTDLLAVSLFESIAPVDAVAGNNDGNEIHKRFGRKKIVQVEDVRVGLVHGDGKRGSTKSRALEAFAGEHVDVVLFGHSHRPFVGRDHGVLIANPGSPTDKRLNPLYSYALLTVDGSRAHVQLKFYASRAV